MCAVYEWLPPAEWEVWRALGHLRSGVAHVPGRVPLSDEDAMRALTVMLDLGWRPLGTVRAETGAGA